MPKNHDCRTALTRSARRSILPPSPNQVADACFHDRSPNSQPLNTAGTIGVVSETDTFDTWFVGPSDRLSTARSLEMEARLALIIVIDGGKLLPEDDTPNRPTDDSRCDWHEPLA
jgi:hypothetical protein